MDKIKIRQALVSVSDKTGLVELARGLAASGVAILSTGGTAKVLAANAIKVTEVADYTGYPEMLDGRLKTLHPKVHGGLLARRDLPEHMAAIKDAGIEPIDLVVVNLYPFRETIAKPDCTFEDAVENIDIGGPTMVRAAAKNHDGVAVLTDPGDYARILDEMRTNGGALGAATRLALAKKAFAHTAAYDAGVANYLTALDGEARPTLFPDKLTLQWEKAQPMRYGENPHQAAAFYRDADPVAGSLARYEQIQGKELSYNNIADADAAWECVKTFERPACVIIKHANPCGVAEGDDCLGAYTRAFKTDPTSAFGGIIAFNRPLDGATADAVGKQFVEVVLAPEISAAARAVLAGKANVRVLAVPIANAVQRYDFKRVGGGLLVQTPDARNVGAADLQDCHPAQADRRRAARPAVRVACCEVREVERDRLLRRRHDARGRRGPDEPRGQRAHRRDQGAERRSLARRLGGRLRRFLSVPRRPRRRRRSGRKGRDPAGRQHARRRGDRGRRRARRGDGVHRRPALPALRA